MPSASNGSFCGKRYFAHKSYCISFVDPAAADALRFCSFASLHLAKVRLHSVSLRMTRSRKDDAQARRDRPPGLSAQVWRYLRSKLTVLSRQDKLELTRRWRVHAALRMTRSRKDDAQARRDRPPGLSAQVWRYLRSKLTVLSRQDKLELTRRWRVWSSAVRV